MKQRISQKGFIQIPLLIGIIIAIVLISGATAGFVFYKQGKLTPLLASVSQTFQEVKQPTTTEPEQVKPEETSQQKQEPEKAKTEIKQEIQQNQQPQTQTGEVDQTEYYRKNIMEMTDLLKEEFGTLKNYINDITPLIDSRINVYNKTISVNTVIASHYPNDDLMYEAFTMLSDSQREDIKYFENTKQYFINLNSLIQKQIDSLNDFYYQIAYTKERLNKSTFEAFLPLMRTSESSISNFSETINETVDSYRKTIKEKDQEYLDSLNLLKSYYESGTYQSAPTISITQIMPTNFVEIENNFLGNVYRQQQLEILQNINDNIYNISQKLSY